MDAPTQTPDTGWDAAATPDAGAPGGTSSYMQSQQTTTPPPPVQPGQAPSTASTATSAEIPKQEMPQEQLPPVVLTPIKPKGIMGIMQPILDSIVGKTRPELATGSDGSTYVKQTDLTGGEKWSRVGATLAAGAAKGLQAGKGGQWGAAVGAGFDEGAKLTDERQKQQTDMSAEAQKMTLQNANNQMLQMQRADEAWKGSNLKTKAAQEAVTFEQGQIDRLTKPVAQGGPGGKIIGTAEHMGDIANILKVQPDVMQKMIQDHQVELKTTHNADGTVAGITAILMPSGYRQQMVPAGATGHHWDAVNNKMEEFKYSDPQMQGEFDDNETAAGNAQLKFHNDQREADLKTQQTNTSKAEAAVHYSTAAHEQAETKALNQATDQTTIDSNARQIYEGSADPSNLSKRGKAYDPTIAAANKISLAETGKPFDIAKAAGDYKFATNPQTVNTLDFLNSLTGRDNKSGNLGTVTAMSAKLGQSKFPPLNDVSQWAKISAGNPDVAAYRAALTETSDQIAKILQGGGSGSGTSDAKLKQAGELLNKSFNADQIKSTADTLRTLLSNRKTELIGDNRYLQRWHGTPTAPAPAAARPTGATGQAKGPDGKMHWADATGKDYGLVQ